MHELFEAIKKLFLNPKFIFVFLKYEIRKAFYDLTCLFKKKYKYNIIFIAGMPMSATTKIKNMCGMIPGYFTRYSPIPYKTRVRQDISHSAFILTPKWSYTIFKTHLNPSLKNLEIIKKNNVKKIIVTYRDLRDVVISRYHRLVNHPKKKGDPHFLDYSLMSKSDAINHSICIVEKYYIDWINGWINISKKNKDLVLFIKFENLVVNPKCEFIKILKFYKIYLNEVHIDHIIKSCEGKKNMSQNLSESKILPWALSSNFRSGKIGYWKNEFSNENLALAKKKLGKALINLKYENDLNWKI